MNYDNCREEDEEEKKQKPRDFIRTGIGNKVFTFDSRRADQDE